jgi:TetR/AcrR family transcriptional regulator, cholesterol catabolism regulator
MARETTYREIRYREKRRRILSSAARIFSRKGYDKTSLEEIAAGLKLSKASLYHYVHSKEELLYLVQLQAIEEARDNLERVLSSVDDPVEKLRRAIRSHVTIITQPHVIGAFRQQEQALTLKWRREIVAAREGFERQLQTIVREGMEIGAFRADDWKMATMAILGALNWTVRWYSNQGRLSASEIGDFMVDFLLRGLGVQPALETAEAVGTAGKRQPTQASQPS